MAMDGGPPDKRQRISNIECVTDHAMKGVLSLAKRCGLDEVAAHGVPRCCCTLQGELVNSYNSKLRRRARKVVHRSGRRSRRKLDGPSFGVGEAYCPPRLTAIAEEYGLDGRVALDLTVPDPSDGTVWDFECDNKQARH